MEILDQGNKHSMLKVSKELFDSFVKNIMDFFFLEVIFTPNGTLDLLILWGFQSNRIIILMPSAPSLGNSV
jgi:hypothetical protein